MQASKMKVGEIYAIERGSSITAFKVEAIDTHRTASKTSNTIRGMVWDVVAERVVGAELKYDPEDFSGLYAVTKAEKDAQEARKAEHKAKQERADERARAILNAFAAHFGTEKPKRVKEYGQFRYPRDLPFRLDYSDKIEVTRAGMEILAAFFKIDVEQKPERAPGIHERMGGVQMTDAEFKQAQENNDPAPTNQT